MPKAKKRAKKKGASKPQSRKAGKRVVKTPYGNVIIECSENQGKMKAVNEKPRKRKRKPSKANAHPASNSNHKTKKKREKKKRRVTSVHRKPKRPAKGAPLSTWKEYARRYRLWQEYVRKRDVEDKKIRREIASIQSRTGSRGVSRGKKSSSGFSSALKGILF